MRKNQFTTCVANGREAKMSSDFEIEELQSSAYQTFISQTPSFPSGFVHLKPFNQVLPRVFLKDYQSIKDFQAKDGDVWVSSFPKCGKD